jgi:hypothetical protein
VVVAGGALLLVFACYWRTIIFLTMVLLYTRLATPLMVEAAQDALSMSVFAKSLPLNKSAAPESFA